MKAEMVLAFKNESEKILVLQDEGSVITQKFENLLIYQNILLY